MPYLPGVRVVMNPAGDTDIDVAGDGSGDMTGDMAPARYDF